MMRASIYLQFGFRYGKSLFIGSLETGRKLGMLLGNTLNVLVTNKGGNKGRHIKMLIELDLTKPLARGTKLKYKQNEIWV